MAHYYVNKKVQDNGYHEVHKLGCSYMPKKLNCIYLGDFNHPRPAVASAKKHYVKADGCFFCSRECHTS
jgi:hypothetical protein